MELTQDKESHNAEPALDATFGLPESFRKALLIGLALASPFFSGCVNAVKEEGEFMDKLPAFPPAAILKNPDEFLDQEIQARGILREVSHDSHITPGISMGPRWYSTDMSSSPRFTLRSHGEHRYALDKGEKGEKLTVVSRQEIETDTPLRIRGHLRKDDDGQIYLDVDYWLTQGDLDKAAK